MGALRSRYVLLVSLLGCSAALLVALLTGVSSGAATPVAKAPAAVAPASDELKPSREQRDLGDEVVGDRTASSRTFRDADGSMTTRVYPQPVNFREGKEWRAIDNTLVDAATDGYVHRRANDGDVLIPKQLSDPFRVSQGGDWLRFSLRGGRGGAEIAGDSVTYPDIADGVDARYQAVNSGIKETLTLAGANVQREFVYDVQAGAGLAPRRAADGSIAFVDGQQRARFSFGAPVVWDSAARPSVSHASELAIAAVAGGWRLTLSVDEQWLKDSSRAFPVIVDPNVQWIVGGEMRYSGAPRDCTLSSATPTASLCADPTLKVGSDAAGTSRANLYFNARSVIPQDATIYDATLLMHASGSGTVPASNLRVRRLSSDWTNAATWTTRNGSTPWGTAGGDVGSEVGPATSISSLNTWNYWRVPVEIVQSWIWGDQPDFGLQVAADAGSPTQAYTFESTDGDPYKWPALDLYWREDEGAKSYYTQDTQQLSDRSQLAVNVANGNLTYSVNDLQLPGTAGLNLGIDRTWSAVENYTPGTFARGWSETYHQTYVHRDADDSLFFSDPTGAHYRFATATAAGTFVSPSGLSATMCTIGVASGCGTDGVSGGVKYKLTYNKSGLRYYFWDPSGQLGAIRDKNNNTIDLDWQNTTTTISGTQGRHVTFDLDSDSYTTSLTDGSRSVNYTRGGADPDWLQSATDPNGKTTQYDYNSDGYLTKITDPLGHQTRIEWEWVADFGSWRATKIIRVLDSTDPTNPAKNPTTSYSYDPANHKTVVTNPVGNSTASPTTDGQTTYIYDKQLRVTRATNPKGLDAETTWTDNSDAQTFGDLAGTANQNLATLAYDAGGLGNLTSAEDKSGAKSTADYYAGGAGFPQSQYAIKHATNANGQSQYYTYDGAGNLSTIKDADASDPEHPTVRNTVTFGYGSSGVDGTVRTATNAGNATTFGYTNHQLTSVTPQADSGNSILGATALTYDSLGRVRTLTDGKSITHTFDYDPLDRVTKDAVNATTYITYTWDAVGNLKQRKEVNGSSTTTTDYCYDDINRRTSETFPGYTNSYSYTLNGQLLNLTEPSGITGYEYDALDRVSKITDPQSAAVTYSYDDTGTATDPRSRTVTLPDSSMTQRTDFDLAGKPKRIIVKSGTTIRSQLDYEYGWTDHSSTGQTGQQITKVTDLAGNVTTYAYGQDGELTDAKTTAAGGSVTERVYEYDDATNRTKLTLKRTSQPDAITTYKYNRVNQLCWTFAGTSANACNSVPTGATGSTYDANGNQLTGGPGGAFGYDSWNRTTTIGTTNLGYLSPTQGELISYGTTNYTNNALGLSGQVTGTAKTYYVRDPSGAVVAQRRYTNNTPVDTDYLTTDALGSTIGLVNGTSTSPVRDYSYDPDGNATSTGSGPTTDIRFAGGQALPAGLYHYGARYYNPNTARWTQQDPLNQIDSLTEANRYGYVGGDPTNLTDPSGCKPRVLPCVATCAIHHCGDTLRVSQCLQLAHSTAGFILCVKGYCNAKFFLCAAKCLHYGLPPIIPLLG